MAGIVESTLPPTLNTNDADTGQHVHARWRRETQNAQDQVYRNNNINNKVCSRVHALLRTNSLPKKVNSVFNRPGEPCINGEKSGRDKMKRVDGMKLRLARLTMLL